MASALDPVLQLINSVLSLTANVQGPGTTANSYREVALRAAIDPGARLNAGRWNAAHRLRPGRVVRDAHPVDVDGPWRVAADKRQLVLVTCGGTLLYQPGYGNTYSDNVLGYATPA